MRIDDKILTEKGLNTGAAEAKTLLLACGALAREILAVIEANGWTHLALHCLPAILHNSPQGIPDAVEAAVLEHRPNYDEIFVVYADCGTGGQLQQRCEDLGVKMMAGPHCYAFFDGVETFEAREEFTAFYLTDFLVRQFDAFVWKPLGLDRYPDLLETYFGNYTKLVHLAQTDDPALTEKASVCAARLGLEFEHRATGYGELTPELARIRP
ncbi:DUF1638 domain-containing protein [Actibacterium pelagium]|uniref:DUF1638 domain-containing protein n=1 Tax=Actibacterium pelagium TaxID=2029103 RepID=UPI001E589E55|nr:DUF1638 domain-containing protein [Actibacterium pelagium]